MSESAVFAALLELDALDGYALRPTGAKNVIDHYLDTPDRDLLRGGYACRMREDEKGGRWLVTVKGRGKAAGAVHEREEHECEEVEPHAPPADWPEGPARDIVTRLSGGKIVELCTIRQHRDLRAVEGTGPGGKPSFLAGYRRDGRRGGPVGLRASSRSSSRRPARRTISRRSPPPWRPTSSSPCRKIQVRAGARQAGPCPHEVGGQKEKGHRRAPRRPLAEEPAAGSCAFTMSAWWRARMAPARVKGHRASIMRVATRRQRAAFRRAVLQAQTNSRAFQDEFADRGGLYLGAVRDLDVLIEAAEKHRSSLSPAAADGLDHSRRMAREARRRPRGAAGVSRWRRHQASGELRRVSLVARRD